MNILSRRDFITKALMQVAGAVGLFAVAGCDGEKYGRKSSSADEGASERAAPASTPPPDSERPENRVPTDELASRRLRQGLRMKCPPSTAEQIDRANHSHVCVIKKDKTIRLREVSGHGHRIELTDDDLEELCRFGEIIRMSTENAGHAHQVRISV